jgi:lyso-ornithine lipid O-acyltransferase
MGSARQLLRNSTVLTRTIVQAMADFRRRSRTANPQPSSADRAAWMHEWCGTAMRRLGIDLRIVGAPPAAGLIVSNHLSYLDIFAFGTAMQCVFVSKAEVRDWPVFGKLTTMAGTVYVDRKRRSDTRNANEGIKRALEQGLRVVIFPEGTSSDGTNVLPFYPSLFEPAVETGAPVTAAHISYALQDGDVGQDVAYWGEMTFFPHLLKLLSKRGLSATVRFSEAARTFSDRKMAAVEMREAVLRLHEHDSSQK